MPISTSQLVALQKDSESIRNICILAHVDHGKTSLSDCLLATNGIVSQQLAGKIRYLDSRPDEQARGITMESSAISLHFRIARRKTPTDEPTINEFLINLIDSPGHIDFSSEVSTASRLCDGALVLVDAVEGVCSQTVTVLRQAWVEHIKPILVINKLDRIITELKMSPIEAHSHLQKLVEQVNAVMGSFFAGERMEDDMKWREEIERKKAAREGAEVSDEVEVDKEYEEKDDEDIYFAPEKGNVVFASAIDGWAFTVRQFASIYERKLGISKEKLEKVLWGDYYFDPKTKRVLGAKHLKGRNLKPMFVQLVLDNIWAVYDSVLVKKDMERTEKIVKSLNLRISPQFLKTKETRALLSAIFAQWLPLSTATLITVIEQIPSPPVSQKQRMPLIIEGTPGKENISSEVKESVINFSTSDDTPVVAYVSKMVAVPESRLVQRVLLSPEEIREQARLRQVAKARELAAALTAPEPSVDDLADSFAGVDVSAPTKNVEKEHLIGFARIYSGTIRVGQELYILQPKYNPAEHDGDSHVQKITVKSLYYIMGTELQPLDEVPAGNVFGIGGLEGKVLKNGTICSVGHGGINLAGINFAGAPIVRVALEPENPSELDELIEGLKLLEQADPCAEYIVEDNGEHVILTAGELHLERCIKDLRERYAKIEIQASAPMVPFRETIVSAAEMPPPKSKDLPRGTVVTTTSSNYVSTRIHTRPLPKNVVDFLNKNVASAKKLYEASRTETSAEVSKELAGAVSAQDAAAKTLSLEEFRAGLKEAFARSPNASKERDLWAGVIDKIVAFGPKRIGPNILIDSSDNAQFKKLLIEHNKPTQKEERGDSKGFSPADFEGLVHHAFALSTQLGPLCNEPVQGIAVFVENFDVSIPDEEVESARGRMGKITGEVIAAVQNSIKQGFLDWSPRLMLAMYSCDIQASVEVLGKVYAVITQRRGRIIAEEMKEGTPFFSISAMLPAVESFGFGDDIRKKTSGAASPQLIFSGFEILDIDPFWEPFTEDELEDLGELADRENIAKKYMEDVRRRKGLFVAKRLQAEKQRTLKR